MELVQIKITGMIITNRYGTLATGDLLRTDAAFARHLVEDCAAAEYVRNKATPSAPAPAEKQACAAEEAPAKPKTRKHKTDK